MKYILPVITLLLTAFIVVVVYVSVSPVQKINSKHVNRIAELSIAKHDPNGCLKLDAEVTITPDPDSAKGGGPYTSYPADNCLRTYYLATNDPAACSLLVNPGGASTCFTYMAKALGNASYCEQTDSPIKGSLAMCRAAATGDIRECDSYLQGGSTYTIAECVSSVVKRTGDYTQCFTIPTDPTDESTLRVFNGCLRAAGQERPAERAEICTFMKYPEGTLTEEKKLCEATNWKD